MIGSRNHEVADAHVKRIVGPTILMGDGAYFDYEQPDKAPVTIEDVAYGLAYTARFRGQTRSFARGGRRCFYSVAQHCVLMAEALETDRHGREAALAGLMHELGEAPCGDMPSPLKLICPEFRTIEKRCEAALLRLFDVEMSEPELIKRYDLRMLATEKRDLMPHSGSDSWSFTEGYAPFPFTIVPYLNPDDAAEEFLRSYWRLAI
jgi:uncharacterized protein